MSGRIGWPALIAIGLGFAAALWAIGEVGFGRLFSAAQSLGWSGFVLLCAGTVANLLLLGGAWLAAMPGEPGTRLGLFAWARAAREASNDLLPFSQIGGLVVGARTLTAAGIEDARVYAGMIVDLTTEMAGQLVMTLFGVCALAALLLHGGRDPVSGAAWLGAALGVLTLAAFVLLQRPLLDWLGRVGARLLPHADLPLVRVRQELDRLYAARRGVALSFLLNLAGWIFTALLAWATLRLMGQRVAVGRVVAVESLIAAVRSAAFVIPGAIGVQEAAYLVLAHAFGISADGLIALSLAKRARDVVLGVPVLLVWQARGWAAARAARPAPGGR